MTSTQKRRGNWADVAPRDPAMVGRSRGASSTADVRLLAVAPALGEGVRQPGGCGQFRQRSFGCWGQRRRLDPVVRALSPQFWHEGDRAVTAADPKRAWLRREGVPARAPQLHRWADGTASGGSEMRKGSETPGPAGRQGLHHRPPAPPSAVLCSQDEADRHCPRDIFHDTKEHHQSCHAAGETCDRKQGFNARTVTCSLEGVPAVTATLQPGGEHVGSGDRICPRAARAVLAMPGTGRVPSKCV